MPGARDRGPGGVEDTGGATTLAVDRGHRAIDRVVDGRGPVEQGVDGGDPVAHVVVDVRGATTPGIDRGGQPPDVVVELFNLPSLTVLRFSLGGRGGGWRGLA